MGGLRALGINRDHPWIQRIASRPWRDGEDVLKVAMRHLPDVFVITPSGSLLAPGLVELQLNPDDLAALCERMELGVISESVSEVYEEQVTAYRARLTGQAGPVCTSPRAGRCRRAATACGRATRWAPRPARRQAEFAYSAAQPAFAASGGTWYEQSPAAYEPGPAAGSGMTTIMAENVPPALRLVTGPRWRKPGCRAPGPGAGRWS